MPTGDGSYELLSSPGLTLNLAKGDRVRIDDTERPAAVLTRGGNFCIQITRTKLRRRTLTRWNAKCTRNFMAA
nr:DUF4265 domain-containing protein [Burkholderia ubonensis]